MNQLALLDDGPRARQSDSWTSHAAAQRVAEFAGSHIDVILACLGRHGPQTIDENDLPPGFVVASFGIREQEAA